MGDTLLKCPLCCGKTFNSKPALLEHLSKSNDNIACPICFMKWSSVWHLIEHLSDDNCQLESAEVANNNVEEHNEGSQSLVQKFEESQEEILGPTLPVVYGKDPLEEFSSTIKSGTENPLDTNSMYMELLSKQSTKPCLQTQQLKLVKDGAISRYVIVTNENADLDAENTIVTKQNNDGTISLTTVRDMKVESDTVITPDNQEAERNEEEIYSCNTCGVSFTSVLDHIQNYHNDQDVVVEEPVDEETGEETISLEFEEEMDTTEENVEKITSRRMITDTGDIIETPITKSPVVEGDQPEVKIKEEVDKKGKGKKRFAVVDKFCDSIILDINKPDDKDKNGPYHRVVIKEMNTSNGEKVTVFNCMSCNVYAASLDQFKSHPCKVLKYSCPHCYISYENNKSLLAHMKVHKNTDPPVVKYSCPHCYISYENHKSLSAHMKVHKNRDPPVVTGTRPTSFVCEFCSTIFVTNKSLKLHKRMHDPVKVRPIEPPVLGAEGGEASTKKFLCTVCNKMIPIDYRTIHQNSHKGLDKFNCDICNKKFSSDEYLDMHMKVHTADKVPVNKTDKFLPYTCLYCDRKFARPHEKVKHERIHTGEKPHACEICGKSFRVSYCLTLHMRTHTGARPYSCQTCGKRFKAHSVYNHHLLTHSDVRAYKCPYCPKAFKTSVQLAGHKNSHTKPFACQICNRPFASLYAVRVHTETHARQNNLKFACALCGASYARAFALNDHVKQAHAGNTQHPAVEEEAVAEWTDGGQVLQPDEPKELPQVPQPIQLNELINAKELAVPS